MKYLMNTDYLKMTINLKLTAISRKKIRKSNSLKIVYKKFPILL
jgi:hypothetical protein